MSKPRPDGGESAPPQVLDLLVIGGGINGVGIARDAAGRGLRVALCEQGDLAQGTSSRSSGLIHGGLRYLEYGELRLVRESLREREVLLAMAPHLVRPMQFVLPHVPQMRPAWMLRLGLFLYDQLAPRAHLPASRAVQLAKVAQGAAVRPEFARGFLYADCRTDDARLVVHNALDAAQRGARIWTRTRFLGARPLGTYWRIRVQDTAQRATHELQARALVNAAGPWVAGVHACIGAAGAARPVRLVRGSHLVVPKFWQGEHGFLLQHTDRRVIFVTPYENDFALVGTTDIAHESAPELAVAAPEETAYLCAAVNRQLRCALAPQQAVHTFSGVRCLLEDEQANPSAVTRDYALDLASSAAHPPLLTVLGGKITTFRRLAEHALEMLRPQLPAMGLPWTADSKIAGLDPSGSTDPQICAQQFALEYAFVPPAHAHELYRRHGPLARQVLAGATALGHLGNHFGAGLYEAEVTYLRQKEWAQAADDVLWRRTKFGLRLNAQEQERFLDWMLDQAPLAPSAGHASALSLAGAVPTAD